MIEKVEQCVRCFELPHTGCPQHVGFVDKELFSCITIAKQYLVAVGCVGPFHIFQQAVTQT
jgi:hypothetical protein